MRKVLTTAVAALALAAAAVPAVASADDTTGNLVAAGLTGGGKQVVVFTTDNPGSTSRPTTIRGLSGDTKLVGIDVRVQDGLIYGVGNAGGVYSYTLGNPTVTKVLQLSVPLEGTSFGVDFNPAANALRVVSNTGQNLRQPFATAGAATVADVRLSTPPTVGDTTGVEAAAYTNNDLDAATGTTLFDLNTTANNLAIQSPANNGTLAATGALTVDPGTDAGLDIYSSTGGGTATVSNDAFAVLAVGGTTGLYSVELTTGKATKVGDFRVAVTDIAIALDQG